MALSRWSSSRIGAILLSIAIAGCGGSSTSPTASDPILTKVSPGSGSVIGGTIATITGTGFLSGARVTFGGTSADAIVVTPTSISARSPAHAEGTVDIVVTNLSGQLGTLAQGFTYILFSDRNGTWIGRTQEGASIDFSISSNRIMDFNFNDPPRCGAGVITAGLSITDNGNFSWTSTSIHFTGTIISTSNAQGTVQACGVSTSWTATHTM
jgi:IPT/TIG domain-containing protein